jgi:hypothetical protein
MYQDLAEIYTEIELFTGRVNKAATDKDANPDALVRMMEAFYKRIKSHNYDQDLKTLRSLRTSIAVEVRGFENVLGLIDGLPSSRVPILEKTKAVIEFNDKFARAIASEQFDEERLSTAITTVRKQEALRHMKLFGEALGQLRVIFQEVGERAAQYDKILDAQLEETKKSIQELPEREAQHGQSLAEDKAEIEAENDAGKTGESSKS